MELPDLDKEAIKIANKIDYPVVIRPSYVIGGRVMEIVLNGIPKSKINHAVKVSGKNPILIDSFISNAIEIDVGLIRWYKCNHSWVNAYIEEGKFIR